MGSRNGSFDKHNTDTNYALNVLIVYDNLAAGQRGMRMCCDLACQQDGDLEFRPRLWRLDLVSDPVCGGFAIADAVNADLLIISTSGQSGLSQAAQRWLRFCLARKRGTGAVIVALLGTDENVHGADFLNIQFLQSAVKEAGLDFFAPLANRKEVLGNVRATGNRVAGAPIDQAGLLDARQIAQAHVPAMLRASSRDTNYRDWGINE